MLAQRSGARWPAVLYACAACSGGGAQAVDAALAGPDAAVDAAVGCRFEPLPANANLGGSVTAGPIQAGAAEAPLGLPVGSALGAYTARVFFLGVAFDDRKWPWSGSFLPSVGIETDPMVRAVAISAGGETVVLVKADLGISNDGLTHDLAARLGLPGKVVLAVSHSHSSWGNFTPNSSMGIGFSRFRRAQYDALLAVLERTARAALDARRPARIGVTTDDNFDPENQVSHDRRSENDQLAGGPRKDSHLVLIRIDGTDGHPIAVIPIFGVHGIVMGYDNPYASTDAPGAIERALEEQFDEPVVVMHLQGAAGDVSPSQGSGIDCEGRPRCFDFARSEKVGRAARPMLYRAWRDAEPALEDTLALEMVTRVIELGPRPETFTVRGGALAYAPWDGTTPGDGRIFDDSGGVISPIDEFNAPFGAPLCGSSSASSIFSGGQIPGAEGLVPYRSCAAISEGITNLLGRLFNLDFGPLPICATTRTAVSVIRFGDRLMVVLPGEPLTLYADRLRAMVPGRNPIVLGYAQGHIGYLLTADDWLQAGFEPSINVWGPLEGELIAEQAVKLAALVATDAREDGAAGGALRWVTPAATDDRDVPPVDPAPLAGTPEAQPPAQVKRLATAGFSWIGEDPLAGTPVVTLQREVEGVFVDLTRRSGRKVRDGDVLRTWTPAPLARAPGEHATHHWAATWQVVTWLDEERAGVPLGRYRFRVEGTGYALESQPFTVVPGDLGVAVIASGSTLTLALSYPSADGFRLVGTPAGTAHVIWRDAAGQKLGESDAAVDASGHATVEAAGAVRSVSASDRFGNTGSASL